MAQVSEKEWSPVVTELGDKIVTLSLLQAKELSDYLKEKHGLEASSSAMAVAMVPQQAAASEAKEEKTEFDVILNNSGANKISVIKVIRAITSLGLKEAKDMVDKTPSQIKTGISKAEAEDIKRKVEEAGGGVEIK